MPRKAIITFNEASLDSRFATIVEKLRKTDEERWDYQKLEAEYRNGVVARLDRIETAVNKTNGRVTALEGEVASMQRFRRRSDSEVPFNWRKHGFWAGVWSVVGAILHWLSSLGHAKS